MRPPLRVAVTGAAGSIGKESGIRIGSGAMFGYDQPVILQLIELPQAMDQLRGRSDGAGRLRLSSGAGYHPLMTIPRAVFWVPTMPVLIGSRPRSKGMERADLLKANAEIFSVQGPCPE